MIISHMNETYIKIITAGAGTTLTALLGGWDISLKLLITVMILDFISGILASTKNKVIDSNVMFWGGIRKGGILTVILLAVLLDDFTGSQSPIFRTMAIFYFIGMEGISLIENYGKLGLPLPPKIEQFFTQLRKEAEDEREKTEESEAAKLTKKTKAIGVIEAVKDVKEAETARDVNVIKAAEEQSRNGENENVQI